MTTRGWHLALLLLTLPIGGCSSTPSDAASTTDGGPGESAPNEAAQAGVLRGPYWSWTTESHDIMGVNGFPITMRDFVYVFRVFSDNGLVYLGDPKATLAEMTCSEPSTGKNRDCQPFSINGDQITIGDSKPVSLKANGTNWDIDGSRFQPIESQEGLTLEGTYTSSGCYSSTCSKTLLTLTASGQFKLRTTSLSGYASDFINSFVGRSDSRSGTYVIHAHGIELTPADGGESKTAFFFRDKTAKRDTIQIGGTWFSR